MILSIRFNHNPESLISYILSLGVRSTPISYVWPNMIDLFILIIPIKYTIKDLALINCKHEVTQKIYKRTQIAIKK